ncbi:cyclic nucleotide-binding domain-containing protein 2 isoform X2 [Hemicordylus capensis]|uniref:cyclic nucleotide-binding domain-containing protein 2 isoform X2 n=1 Tax=Hemicordylus capensis TaxID=884348 RepID=UPI0023025B72|nr:cyclic nucleotide-binding domain-containing protein 2 isoform X2 [Hemicordylus capensis]XP_053139416.1 cyclic nucleotide-binding domain-containing protein 2 isoform X2 [Hemicordylus capensis]XP_053139427.1 cyclic nucleotide-binding domain-containing protein 2 isoform X2 [Hemicordylus capensis]XP_053139438.1 cyclic nucleotide-binding domain-containing protein 2 isoform X2 [Hemicordylus capensis]
MDSPTLGYKQSSAGPLRGIKAFYNFIVELILLIRACKCFRLCLRGFSGFQLLEYHEGIEEKQQSSSIVFDRHEFSISKDHFPLKAIQITRKPPAWRTDAEVKQLQNRMLLLESYRQYSPNLQSLLARVVRFERFARRRVVIRKGHIGSSFYFIYCGMVAVTDDYDGSHAFVDSAPTLIRKGLSFGEVALLKGTLRVATVVCVEETELLVVDKKDFFAYKLDMQLEQEARNRYEYLRTLSLFETMPDDSVEEVANFCKVERFNYGQVITNDIAGSTTIIFITKGACEVLRLVELSTCPSYRKWLSKQLGFPKRELHMKERRQMGSDIACVDRFKSTTWNSFTGQKLSELKEYYTSQPLNKLYEGYERQSSIFKNHRSVLINVEPCVIESLDYGQQDDGKEVVQSVVSGSLKKKQAYYTSYGDVPASVAAAVYVRVDELHKGEYITNLQDTRQMILVSKGAEIIRFRKEKFEELIDNVTTVKLYNLTVKYPSDDELCQVFLRHNAWEMFKKDLLKLVMKPKLMKMVHPPDPRPTDEIYESWFVNQAGILDLTAIRNQKDLPPEKYRYIPVQPKQAKESLPEIEPRLIHGITTVRPSLHGEF